MSTRGNAALLAALAALTLLAPALALAARPARPSVFTTSNRLLGAARIVFSRMASNDPPQEPLLAALASQLDEMTLHDDTGDPRDEGYMAAVRELRGWIKEQTGQRANP